MKISIDAQPTAKSVEWKHALRPGIDPYLIWGAATDFADFELLRDGQARHLWRVIIELRTNCSPKKLELAFRRINKTFTFAIPAIYFDGKFKFCTATVDRHALLVLANGQLDVIVERFAIATAIADPEGPRDLKILEQVGPKRLSGNVVAVIDTGCPFVHHVFRLSNGKSRVRFLWHQGKQPSKTDYVAKEPVTAWQPVWPITQPPSFKVSPLIYGAELSQQVIDDLVSNSARRNQTEQDIYDAIGYTTLRHAWTHGGSILSLMAGNDCAYQANPDDEAAKAEVIFVQLPNSTVADAAGLSMAGYVLDALQYIRARTIPGTHISLTLSFGRHAGPHDGSSLAERAINDFLNNCGRDVVISIAAANSNLAAGHAVANVSKTSPVGLVWQVNGGCPVPALMELWYPTGKSISVTLRPPSSATRLTVSPGEAKVFRVGSDVIATAVHSAAVTIRSDGQHMNCVLLAIAPTLSITGKRREAPYGDWKLIVESTGKSAVKVHAWIERSEQLIGVGFGSRQSHFGATPPQDADDEFASGSHVTKFSTLNGLATLDSAKVIVVGASYLDGELTPYTAAGPELCRTKTRTIDKLMVGDFSNALPGVPIVLTTGVGMGRVSGTSAAAPQWARFKVSRTVGIPTEPSCDPPVLADQRGKAFHC